MKHKVCNYVIDNGIGHKPFRCMKWAYYGINGVYYCYEHKRILEIIHLESIRR